MAQNRPKWEQDQITSFVAWANFRWAESLKARGRPVAPLINDITQDFRDGTKAAMLLMVLFGRQIRNIKKTGRHIDNIQNWAILLNEMKREGIDFRKDSTDLVSGDIPSTLAFQWALIRHDGSKLAVDGLGAGSNKATKTNAATSSTAVEASGAGAGAGALGSANDGNTTKQMSIKEQMLRYLNTYLPPNLQVTNFTTSFQDGRVIQHLLSNLAHVNVQDSADPKTLLENCFTAAEHSLGIPVMVSAVDMAQAHVAEEPVMTYVISILQAIRNSSEEGKKAAAASSAHLADLEGDSQRSSSEAEAAAARAAAEAAAREAAERAAAERAAAERAAAERAAAERAAAERAAAERAAAERAAAEKAAADAAAAAALPPPPPPLDATFSNVPAAQSYSASYGQTGVAGGQAVGGGQAGQAFAGNQNYYGSIVQGSVMMELPEIFKIVAFGDFNNFVTYADAHPNEIAEPYRINILFTAARLVPHVTAKKFIEYILTRYPTAHTLQDKKLNYPIHEALEYGCLENFEYLWNLPNAPRPPLASLVHAAVWPTSTECLDRVLRIVYDAHGGNIPPLDNFVVEGRTPLITALSTPATSLDMVRLLLSRGCNPGFSAIEGQSPALVVAAACDKWDAVSCMVRESLYQPLPLPRLLVALIFIVGVTAQTISQFIRMTGTNTNDEDPQTGRTPLEHAVSLARGDIVTALLQNGAQVNRVSGYQPWRTPIHYALLYYAQDAHKYLEVVRVLQAWGADFNTMDANGQPASNYARSLGLPPNPVGFAASAVM